MDAPHQTTVSKATVGLFDSDAAGLAAARATLARRAPSVSVVIAVSSWGELLTNEAFPPDIVVLRPRPDDRVSLPYEARVCRIVEASVLAIVDADGDDAAAARGVTSLLVANTLDEAADLLEGWPAGAL
ncbi:hypothetical protein ACFJGV_06390 [Cnuibacter sp. UC19_7]|uniref:hypothetical protein n=1 Tax=Cnuibacter sp. UC19_7 TaxID=3350166 RepID=UPI00366E370E